MEDGRDFAKYLGERYNKFADDWDDYLHLLFRKRHFPINDWCAYIGLAEEIRKSRSLNAQVKEETEEAIEPEPEPEHDKDEDEDEQITMQPEMTMDDKENTTDQNSGGNGATDTQKQKDKGKMKETFKSAAAQDQYTSPQPRISEYERQKLANIEENRRIWGILMPGGPNQILSEKEKVKKTRAPKEKRIAELTERQTRSMKRYVAKPERRQIWTHSFLAALIMLPRHLHLRLMAKRIPL